MEGLFCLLFLFIFNIQSYNLFTTYTQFYLVLVLCPSPLLQKFFKKISESVFKNLTLPYDIQGVFHKEIENYCHETMRRN